MTKITLTNDFHNTSYTINCEAAPADQYDDVEITKSQYYHALSALCGCGGCGCGGTRGCDYNLCSDYNRYGERAYYLIKR